MTIQDLKNLDFYKCSQQDIVKADNTLRKYLNKLINSYQFNTKKYKEIKSLHILIVKARLGYGLDYNGIVDRLPNSESVL